MMAGIPVIAPNFPLYREVVEGSKCGICVDPTNVRELADAILRLMDDPRQALQMGQNGQEAVRKLYNWEHEGKHLVQAYEKIFDNR